MTPLSEANIEARIQRCWTIYVCAEPDGAECDSGTHRYLLRHKCAALRRWHEAMDARNSPDEPVTHPGPRLVAVEVAPVKPSEAIL